MNRLFFFTFLLTTSLSNAQVNSSCNVPPILASEYKRDLVQLATFRLFETHNSDTMKVRIPQTDLDSVSGGLAAIFNATSIAERDSVFNLYCVHDHNGWPYDYAGLLVKVDTSYTWTQAWQNMNTLTGNAYIDFILTTYSLHITNFYNWSFGSYAELGTDSSWNVLALIDTIEQAPGVQSAESNYYIGEAGKITYSVSGGSRYYDFYFEFNDCFDGCDNYRDWSFSVDGTCTVNYLGFSDWGVFGIQPLPLPLNCNTFTSSDNVPKPSGISIFPNPVHDNLIVRFNTLSLGSIQFILYDCMGKECKRISAVSNDLEVGMKDFSEGIYFFTIADKEIILASGKILKQ